MLDKQKISQIFSAAILLIPLLYLTYKETVDVESTSYDSWLMVATRLVVMWILGLVFAVNLGVMSASLTKYIFAIFASSILVSAYFFILFLQVVYITALWSSAGM